MWPTAQDVVNIPFVSCGLCLEISLTATITCLLYLFSRLMKVPEIASWDMQESCRCFVH
jgi:hypothetical protein